MGAMSEPIPVRVRECPDGTHPDGDVVYLRPRLSLEGGLAAEQDLADVWPDQDALARRWTVTFVRYGVTGWNLHEPGGEAIPYDLSLLLDDYALAHEVAERANDLYAGAVIDPLRVRLLSISRGGPTDGSTSPNGASTRKPRRRSSARASDGQQSQTAR